jgi:anti-anti-sigma factor
VTLIEAESNGTILKIAVIASDIVDEETVRRWQAELFSVCRGHREPKVLLDFARVVAFTSSALGVLVLANVRFKTARQTVKLCGLAPDLRKVFHLTGMDKIFDVYPTAAEALAAFRGDDPEGLAGVFAPLEPRPSGGSASREP